MRILVTEPGHLRTVHMGRFSGDALKKLGHEVRHFDEGAHSKNKLRNIIHAPWSRTQEENPIVNAALRSLIMRWKPDLLFAVFGMDISRETLSFAKEQGVTTVRWWLNDPFQLKRSLKKSPHYDVVFSNDAHCVAEYKQVGVKRAYFLPVAVSEDVHRPLPPDPALAADVIFAGDWCQTRERFMTTLAENFNLRIFGPWGKKIADDSPLRPYLNDGFFTPEEMVQIFCSGKVIINIHSWYGISDHGTNPRIFEACGCGSFQLVDSKQEIPELYEPDREIVLWRDEKELVEKVGWALENEDKRLAIGRGGLARTLKQHTYIKRMEQMLGMVAGQK
jgi:spore maturation protein CgeB